MKKFFATLLLVFVSLFALAACKGKGGSSSGGGSSYSGDPVGVTFHYQRADKNYTNFNSLWIWSTSHPDGSQVMWEGQDKYGAYLTIQLSEYGNDTAISFIVRSDSWAKDPDMDRTADLTCFKTDSNGIYHVYLKSGDENIYTSEKGDLVAAIKSFAVQYQDGNYVLNIVLAAPYKTFTITKNGTNLLTNKTVKSDKKVLKNEGKTVIVYNLGTTMPDFSDSYFLSVKFNDGSILEQGASMGALYDTDAFTQNYTYTGALGAIYSAASTTFRVWSPVCTSIKLRIYENGTPTAVNATTGSDEYQEYEMTKGDKGTWEYTLTGDQEGKYYTYVVNNYKWTDKECVDPYAYSTGVNGQRGMVVDFAKTNPTGWDNVNVLPYTSTQLAVYETHIADLTSSDTWGGTAANAKLFKGFYEEGTTYTEGNVTVSTGFDHVKELGVNAVQIIPIFDAANDETNPTFNWGYNPLNYNSLDGIYSSNPYDGYEKIKEFKNLVMAYNKAGINIIMDVVYNHVSGAEGSQFDVLVPGYYYRYNDTVLSNGSGCGNETASDRAMFQKFMVDSTEFWAKEYKLGGFRFDLMGLHDIDTMSKLSKNLHENVSEYITVYGEPWTGGDSPLAASASAKQANLAKYGEFGCFNDKLRDALIKGGLNSDDTLGWITTESLFRTATTVTADNFAEEKDTLFVKDGDNYVRVGSAEFNADTTYYTQNASVSGERKDLKNGIFGKILSNVSSDPSKCVNYATCHDNCTLYDRIKAAGITDEATVKSMAMLANSVVFTSQGISFMLAGEEFLRTKGGDHNSYASSYEVNELDYSLKVKHLDMFANYQKLIALKKSGTVFSLSKEECETQVANFQWSSDYAMAQYKITSGNKEYFIIHADGLAGSLADRTVDLTGYTVYLDTLGTYAADYVFTSSVEVGQYQTIIAYKTITE